MTKRNANIELLITGHQVEVTSAIKMHIEKNIERLKRHLMHEDEVKAHVIISVTKNVQSAEISMQALHNHFFAEEKGKDLYVSIDKALQKLERQLIKQKDKITKEPRVIQRNKTEC